jgi:hypothetical protein
MSTIPRKCHVLKSEKSVAIPRHFVFFDTETTQTRVSDTETKQTFKLGWACHYRRAYGRHPEQHTWFFIRSPFDFWQFVYGCSEVKQKLWLIARNVVFDFTILDGWKYLKREGYKLKFFYNSSAAAIVSVHKKGSSLVFCDSMNWFLESLAATGERIGIPKMKIDFETCSESELIAYCKNDVLIELENFKLFLKFLQENRISRLCYTRASTAMAAYLYRHYHVPIYIHNNAEAIRLERESYKGGRCECFALGDLSYEPHYILDVNSLYPTVMRDGLYPVKYRTVFHNPSIKDMAEMVRSYAVHAKVRVKTKESVYAIKRDRTIFPVGRFVVGLCTPEIEYAIEQGHLEEVYDAYLYDRAQIFKTYVTQFYEMRQRFKASGQAEYDEICKKLLNSLYGKFGQKGENWVKIGTAPDEPDREETTFRTRPRLVVRIRYLLGEVWELKGYSECFNSFPGIAAHVTAYGRMYLWNLMKIAGHGNYVYCDTDSLIVNDEGRRRLMPYLDQKRLGALKLEKTVTHLVIRGLKDYDADDKTAIKGVRKSAVKVAEGVYQQEMWPTFKGLFRSGNASHYIVKKVLKHLKRNYTKGQVTDEGLVVPFVLDETE